MFDVCLFLNQGASLSKRPDLRWASFKGLSHMSSMWLMITEARLQSFGKACDLEAFPCLSLALICSAPSLPCPPTHSCPSPGNLSAVSQVTDSDRSFVCPGLLRPGTIFRWKGKGDGGENTRDSSKAGGVEGGGMCVWVDYWWEGFGAKRLQKQLSQTHKKMQACIPTPNICSPAAL